MIKKLLAAVLMTVFAQLSAQAALECRLVVTNAVNQLDQFQHIMQNRPPFIPSCSKFVPEQPIMLGVLFSGPTIVDGQADVSYDMAMTGPDGKISQVIKDHPGMKGRSNGKGVFYSSLGMLAFSGTDKLGKYTLTVLARDNKGGVTAENSATFTLEKLVCDWTTVSEEELNRMISVYYRQPQPEKVPGMIRTIFNSVPKLMSKKKSFNPTALYFTISELLRYNPQYLEEAAKQADAAQGGERTAWEFILAAQDQQKLSKTTMTKELADAVDIRSRRKSPFALDFIDSPSQIDMLWSEFFITGNYKPVKRIAEELDRFNFAMTPEEFKASKQQDDDRQKLKNYLMARATEWSLGANMKGHSLLTFYVESMIARNELRPEAVQRAKQLMRNQIDWVKSELEKRKQAQTAETNKEKTPQPGAGETSATDKR